jgi:hypothetical protein
VAETLALVRTADFEGDVSTLPILDGTDYLNLLTGPRDHRRDDEFGCRDDGVSVNGLEDDDPDRGQAIAQKREVWSKQRSERYQVFRDQPLQTNGGRQSSRGCSRPGGFRIPTGSEKQGGAVSDRAERGIGRVLWH